MIIIIIIITIRGHAIAYLVEELCYRPKGPKMSVNSPNLPDPSSCTRPRGLLSL
jgi:hypothetical protein